MIKPLYKKVQLYGHSDSWEDVKRIPMIMDELKKNLTKVSLSVFNITIQDRDPSSLIKSQLGSPYADNLPTPSHIKFYCAATVHDLLSSKLHGRTGVEWLMLQSCKAEVAKADAEYTTLIQGASAQTEYVFGGSLEQPEVSAFVGLNKDGSVGSNSDCSTLIGCYDHLNRLQTRLYYDNQAAEVTSLVSRAIDVLQKASVVESLQADSAPGAAIVLATATWLVTVAMCFMKDLASSVNQAAVIATDQDLLKCVDDYDALANLMVVFSEDRQRKAIFDYGKQLVGEAKKPTLSLNSKQTAWKVDYSAFLTAAADYSCLKWDLYALTGPNDYALNLVNIKTYLNEFERLIVPLMFAKKEISSQFGESSVGKIPNDELFLTGFRRYVKYSSATNTCRDDLTFAFDPVRTPLEIETFFSNYAKFFALHQDCLNTFFCRDKRWTPSTTVYISEEPSTDRLLAYSWFFSVPDVKGIDYYKVTYGNKPSGEEYVQDMTLVGEVAKTTDNTRLIYTGKRPLSILMLRAVNKKNPMPNYGLDTFSSATTELRLFRSQFVEWESVPTSMDKKKWMVRFTAKAICITPGRFTPRKYDAALVGSSSYTTRVQDSSDKAVATMYHDVSLVPSLLDVLFSVTQKQYENFFFDTDKCYKECEDQIFQASTGQGELPCRRANPCLTSVAYRHATISSYSENITGLGRDGLPLQITPSLLPIVVPSRKNARHEGVTLPRYLTVKVPIFPQDLDDEWYVQFVSSPKKVEGPTAPWRSKQQTNQYYRYILDPEKYADHPLLTNTMTLERTVDLAKDVSFDPVMLQLFVADRECVVLTHAQAIPGVPSIVPTSVSRVVSSAKSGETVMSYISPYAKDFKVLLIDLLYTVVIHGFIKKVSTLAGTVESYEPDDLDFLTKLCDWISGTFVATAPVAELGLYGTQTIADWTKQTKALTALDCSDANFVAWVKTVDPRLEADLSTALPLAKPMPSASARIELLKDSFEGVERLSRGLSSNNRLNYACTGELESAGIFSSEGVSHVNKWTELVLNHYLVSAILKRW